VPRKLPPPFLPAIGNDLLARGGHPPKITLPANEMTLSQTSARTAGIPLRAETESDVRKLYWFADKTFIGVCEAHDVLCWKPTPGIYQPTALGRSWALGDVAVRAELSSAPCKTEVDSR